MTHKKENAILSPSLNPSPPDGGGPGGGEKRWEIFSLFLGYISVKFYNIIYLRNYLIII